MTRPRTVHRFESSLTWTGASAGGTSDYRTYSREVTVAFVDKPTLRLSAAPAFRGDGSVHNPEDLLLASLSVCHCLSFLAVCARQGIVVREYRDEATAQMENVDGVMRFSQAMLRPSVLIEAAENLPRLAGFHRTATKGCFIRSSVNFPVDHEATERSV